MIKKTVNKWGILGTLHLEQANGIFKQNKLIKLAFWTKFLHKIFFIGKNREWFLKYTVKNFENCFFLNLF